MHCQQCGSTDREDVVDTEENDGYSMCCNEVVIWGECAPMYCYHPTTS